MTQNQEFEILAPVGDWAMCQAAVHNGADAIYIGMPNFNARGRATTFSLEELKKIIDYCHLYQVKVFIAFNVLIFEAELEILISKIRAVIELGPDAFLVQDIGVARLIKFIAPEQEIHASTQMTITDDQSIEITKDLDISRYVLGREVSISEMQKIRAKTEKELEVFVHGALCVAYSGQCLTSESMGGRSANRGQCAQACRLDYQLIVDGQKKDLGNKRYLVSPKDLCGLEDIPRLMEVGINSFKIEGRLKKPEYVANTVTQYRKVVDDGTVKNLNKAVQDLKISYSRDFFNGWLDGVNHQKLVGGEYSNNHGLEIGRIVRINHTSVDISSTRELKAGDGLVFCDFKKQVEIGAQVYATEKLADNQVRIKFARDFQLNKLAAKMHVFINSCPSLDKELNQKVADKKLNKRLKINAKVEGDLGTTLKLTFSDHFANQVQVESPSLLVTAQNAALQINQIKEEISALSASPFILDKFEVKLGKNLFLNHKEIKNLRQAATQKLIELRSSPKKIQLKEWKEAQTWLHTQSEIVVNDSAQSLKLDLLLREKNQIESLNLSQFANSNIGIIYLDYEFGKEYHQSIEQLRNLGFKVGIATTRILKPNELGHLKLIERLKPDSVLIRNLGALNYFQGSKLNLVGDFSLNVSNHLSAEWLLNKGLSQLCPSYDLNQEQLVELLEKSTPEKFSVTVHQYMPTFHMEHCVFAAFLSKGSSYRDCGRPCEKHRVELLDNKGVAHALKADAECRNTMFNGEPQSAARLIPKLIELGVKNFRLEALYEEPKILAQKIKVYLDLLDQKIDSKNLFNQLGIVEKYGVTEGQLYNIKNYQDRKKSLSL